MIQCGFWDSPISNEVVATSRKSFEDLACISDTVFWTESRPLEKGRYALCFYHASHHGDLLNASENVKSRVYEYGGGALSSSKNFLYYVKDQARALFRKNIHTGQEDKLFAKEDIRCADLVPTQDDKFLYFVAEDISFDDPKSAIFCLDLKNLQVRSVLEGDAFYSSIRCSHDGKNVTFLSWNFPNMPWDSTTVWAGKIGSDGTFSDLKKISEGYQESCVQPIWLNNGLLYFVSDRSGYWNIYEYDGLSCKNIFSAEADFTYPQWKLGRYFYAEVLYEGQVALFCSYTKNATDQLGIFIPSEKKWIELASPYTSISHIVSNNYEDVFFFGGSAVEPLSVIHYKISSNKFFSITSSMDEIPTLNSISLPQSLFIPTSKKKGKVHAFYYPPNHPIENVIEPPPVIFRAHSGPTSHAAPLFNLEVQFWTSRGFAFVEINYRGSSGFGRQYRDALKGNWGLVDVEDCISVAQYIFQKGLGSPKQSFIKGSSAGGLTAIMSLISSSCFRAAVSYYGVLDLEGLYFTTHKFEKCYNDSLIGPYPQLKEQYQQRSPLHNIHLLHKPVLFFQGKEDHVVPPYQSEDIFLKLRELNVAAQLVLFDNEGHGLRRADSIKKALTTELKFYQQFLV
ncbi:MAG: S9 family peptidase [Chlamydiae bacterium]|nr:S9 family peptidase [Chlamydiota bacterium]